MKAKRERASRQQTCCSQISLSSPCAQQEVLGLYGSFTMQHFVGREPCCLQRVSHGLVPGMSHKLVRECLYAARESAFWHVGLTLQASQPLLAGQRQPLPSSKPFSDLFIKGLSCPFNVELMLWTGFIGVVASQSHQVCQGRCFIMVVSTNMAAEPAEFCFVFIVFAKYGCQSTCWMSQCACMC